jgi:cytoskeletal protein RodZ
MERLGHYLRAERTKRGMSLEEVSARTRIRLLTLEALERDDYPALPVEVTVKGFLRAYARCLALDEQQVLSRYQEFAAEYFKPAADAGVSKTSAAGRQQAWQHRLTLVGLTAAAIMVVISGVVALSPRTESDHPTAISAPIQMPLPLVPAPAPSAEEPSADHPPADAPATGQPGPATSPAPAPPVEAAKAQQLAVVATETSWVQVTIDNGETNEAILQPGERASWSAEQTFKLTVGNAGGVNVEFNGESLSSLGPSGKVRTVVLPRVALNLNAGGAARSASTTTAPPAPQLNAPPALTSPADSTTVPPHPLQ